MAARRAQEAFGIGQPDVKLLPYWHEGIGIEYDRARAKVTVYLRPGKLLLCVANPSEEALPGFEIRLDRVRLGLPEGLTARDAITGEARSVEGGAVRCSVPAKRVVFVEVR